MPRQLKKQIQNDLHSIHYHKSKKVSKYIHVMPVRKIIFQIQIPILELITKETANQ